MDVWTSVLDGVLVLFALVLAVFVLGAGRGRSLVYLSVFLFLTAVNNAAWALHALPGIAGDPVVTYNLSVLAAMSFWALLMVYVVFFSTALDTPLTKPLRTPVGQGILLALGAAGAALPYLLHRVVVAGPFRVDEQGHSSWAWDPTYATIIVWAGIAVFSFAILCALTAFARARRNTESRRRALAYLYAFVFIDLTYLGWGFMAAFYPSDGSPALRNAIEVFLLSLNIAALLLLTRALLKWHLFDFEVRVKWAVRRGTLAGIFVAAFLVVVSVAQIYLQQLGIILGGIVIGLLLFALRPLQRVADRLADAAMPRAGTADHLALRKAEVYRAAVESALEEDGIDDRERRMLDRLQAKLGLARAEALRVEAETAAAIGNR